ncbi:MAG TPA: CocE/NonD family hydrolase [Syntrophorhabdaceae bacterium]|nr:CocE/NonD family hydrolase [Syntrophorhabdaceae bacterium]HQM81668.1 CocE/NonD family hydrolase [Syntrophorhabdaceae bacterium]
MSIKRVSIESDHTLEGVLRPGSRGAGVVICHPHPLYGGDMNNNVVRAMEEGFSRQGYTTLIFNFRGVGGSGGEYDEGEGEVRDAIAASEHLRQHLDPDNRIMCAGYSFGAWVVSRAALQVQGLEGLFLVSYPFLIYKGDHLKTFDKKIYFIGGTYDDIAPLDDLLAFYKHLEITEKYLKVIPTTHFYGGKEEEIADFIKESVEPAPGNNPP